MNKQLQLKKKPKWKVRYTVLFVLWLCWLFSFLDRMVITIALPYIGEDLNLTATAQGLLLSIFLRGMRCSKFRAGCYQINLAFVV